MLKLWGAAAIFSSALCVIFLRQRERRTLHRQLRQWIVLLEAMESEVRWHQVPLGAFLEKQPLTSEISQYLKSKNTLQQSWSMLLEKTGDGELSERLSGLNFSADRESLLNGIAGAVQSLYALDDHRRSEAESKGKTQSAAVLCAAGLLIILLL